MNIAEYFIFFLLLIVIIQEFIPQVFASPSFVRQIIIDPPYDWDIVYTDKNFTFVEIPGGEGFWAKIEKNLSNCKTEQNGFRPPDIEAVTYFSDGKTLNATLWLSDEFIDPPLNASEWLSPEFKDVPWYRIRYAMSSDIRSVYDTGETDYSSIITWDVYNPAWKMITEERASTGETRVVYQKDNDTNFFGKGSSYVDLSLDLDILNSPDQYNLLFYTADSFIKDGMLCRLIDISNRVYVPPPDFIISTSASSVELRPGEEKKIEVQLKGTTNIKSQAFFSTNQTDDLELTFDPNPISVSPQSGVTSILQIKAANDANDRPYTVPIFANISIPTEAKILSERGGEGITNNSVSETITENSNLTVTVRPPLRADEQLNIFYNTWLSSISGIWTFLAGVAAVIAPLAIRIYSNNKNKNKNKNKKLSDF
jgi:hypothetical protein